MVGSSCPWPHYLTIAFQTRAITLINDATPLLGLSETPCGDLRLRGPHELHHTPRCLPGQISSGEKRLIILKPSARLWPIDDGAYHARTACGKLTSGGACLCRYHRI